MLRMYAGAAIYMPKNLSYLSHALCVPACFENKVLEPFHTALFQNTHTGVAPIPFRDSRVLMVKPLCCSTLPHKMSVS